MRFWIIWSFNVSLRHTSVPWTRHFATRGHLFPAPTMRDLAHASFGQKGLYVLKASLGQKASPDKKGSFGQKASLGQKIVT